MCFIDAQQFVHSIEREMHLLVLQKFSLDIAIKRDITHSHINYSYT